VISPDRSFVVGNRLCELRVDVDVHGAVRLGSFAPRGRPSVIAPHRLVTVFTSREQQHSRMSHGYADSAIGERLRYVSHDETQVEGTNGVEVVQRDEVSGIVVVTRMAVPGAASAVRLTHEIHNGGDDDVRLLAASSMTVGLSAAGGIDELLLVWGESGWVTEGRWHEDLIGELLAPVDVTRFGSDAAPRFSLTSHGSWSTGRFLPCGAVVDISSGSALAWQIESSGPWHWEVGRTRAGGYLALLGPTDTEHQFSTNLAPGQSFVTATAAIAVSAAGRDGAFAALTDYRRSIRELRPVDAALPVIYNDFTNTLMGDPTTERLEPLIRAAADVGAEYFCVDAGWFAEPESGDWWDRVGGWTEGRDRFTGGLASVVELIRSLGMVPGLWLEPEVVGVTSPVAEQLPEAAFFQRFGRRVVTQSRYHLDFRHSAARDHVDAAIDDLVERFGIGMFKLDYNIDPGPGTDTAASSAGEGMLGHVRAHRRWLADAQERHPGVLFENCASGAMRMDYGLLSLAHIQSTSDQQDHLLYAAIAASAPASLLPEQSGNWAYPAVGMDDEETAFSLTAGLVGRLYLSGFLDRLRDGQRDLVREAVTLAKEWRQRITASHPVWPLDLPKWDAPQVALALDCGDEYLLAVWSRGQAADVTMSFPGPVAPPCQVFPQNLGHWHAASEGGHVTIAVPAGPAARLMRVAKV